MLICLRSRGVNYETLFIVMVLFIIILQANLKHNWTRIRIKFDEPWRTFEMTVQHLSIHIPCME